MRRDKEDELKLAKGVAEAVARGVLKSKPRVSIILENYHNPEVDGIWAIQGIHEGSLKDHVLPTPGWLYI